MKRRNRARRIIAVALLGGCVLGGTACDQQVTGQMVTLSGGFLGDVVSVVATRYLQVALGIEAVEADAADEHEHDAGALHDHEH